MSTVGFEQAIPASERPQTHDLDCAATGIGTYVAWIRSDLPVKNADHTILNRVPVPGPGINYTGPREVLLELITNLNVILYSSTCHIVHIIVLILFMIMP